MKDETRHCSNDPVVPPWFEFSPPSFPTIRQITADDFGLTLNQHLASILFGGLRAEIQGPDATLSAVVIAAFELPVELLGEDGFLGYTADFRGFCAKSAGARATLIAQVGGATFTRDFAYDLAEDGKEWSGRVFSFEQRPPLESNPDAAPLSPLTVNILLSVQRLTVEDSVTFSLDSLDVSAIRG